LNLVLWNVRKKLLPETAKIVFCRRPIKAHLAGAFCIDTEYCGWYNDLKLKDKFCPQARETKNLLI
jgi:hypothetical protein